jgi:hypothetical protein
LPTARLLSALLLSAAAFAVALILLPGLTPLAALLSALTSLTSLASLLTALLAALLAALVLLTRTLLLVIALLHGLRLLSTALHVEYSSEFWIRHYGEPLDAVRM